MGETNRFDRDTQVVPVAGEESSFQVEIPDGWRSGAGICGGLLMALAGRACGFEAAKAGKRHTRPLSLTASFLSVPEVGVALLNTQTLRSGGRHTTVGASVTQEVDGSVTERLRVMAWYAEPYTLVGTDLRLSLASPQLLDPEDCVGAEVVPSQILEQAPMVEQMDLRLDPRYAGWLRGVPSGWGVQQGWLRFPGREPDSLMLLLAVDALPSANWDLGVDGFASTIELTAHVRALPAPGWLRLSSVTRNYVDGYLDQDVEVWDSADRLVAQARHLAMVVPRA